MTWLGRLRRKWAGAPVEITESLWRSAEAGLGILSHLTPPERDRLRRLAVAFLNEKQWYGAHGLIITAEMQLVIALQACLLVLNLGLARYAGWVGIIVYPGDFLVPRKVVDQDGIVHEYDDEVVGEAWEHGPVVLSWADVDYPERAVNLVIHEFAHKLDMETGAANGRPYLGEGMSRRSWTLTFNSAYRQFCSWVDRGVDLPLDPYAAVSPAEFFAVMSEAFFVEPVILQRELPTVYEQLRLFYQQNPLMAGNENP